MHSIVRTVLLLVVLTVVSVAPSCRSLDASRTPPEVVAIVDARQDALRKIESAFLQGMPVTDAALIAELQVDLAGWARVRELTDTVTAGEDLKAVLQTQQVGLGIAIEKIEAGEYTQDLKIELVHSLIAAWDSLDTYYNPIPES